MRHDTQLILILCDANKNEVMTPVHRRSVGENQRPPHLRAASLELIKRSREKEHPRPPWPSCCLCSDPQENTTQVQHAGSFPLLPTIMAPPAPHHHGFQAPLVRQNSGHLTLGDTVPEGLSNDSQRTRVVPSVPYVHQDHTKVRLSLESQNTVGGWVPGTNL